MGKLTGRWEGKGFPNEGDYISRGIKWKAWKSRTKWGCT